MFKLFGPKRVDVYLQLIKVADDIYKDFNFNKKSKI